MVYRPKDPEDATPPKQHTPLGSEDEEDAEASATGAQADAIANQVLDTQDSKIEEAEDHDNDEDKAEEEATVAALSGPKDSVKDQVAQAPSA